MEKQQIVEKHRIIENGMFDAIGSAVANITGADKPCDPKETYSTNNSCSCKNGFTTVTEPGLLSIPTIKYRCLNE